MPNPGLVYICGAIHWPLHVWSASSQANTGEGCSGGGRHLGNEILDSPQFQSDSKQSALDVIGYFDVCVLGWFVCLGLDLFFWVLRKNSRVFQRFSLRVNAVQCQVHEWFLIKRCIRHEGGPVMTQSMQGRPSPEGNPCLK